MHESTRWIMYTPVSGTDLQYELAVADHVDHRSLAQQAIRHGLAVRVDVAVHQEPRLQRGDHLVQALEAAVGQVFTVAAMPWGGVGEQDVDVTSVAAAESACRTHEPSPPPCLLELRPLVEARPVPQAAAQASDPDPADVHDATISIDEARGPRAGLRHSSS